MQLRSHFSPGQLLRGPANQLADLKNKIIKKSKQTKTKRGQESATMMDDCNARQLVPLCETVEQWVVENKTEEKIFFFLHVAQKVFERIKREK